jgi:hypothetical protein
MALGSHPRTSSTDLPTSTRRRKSLTRHLRHIRRPAVLVGQAGPDRVAPGNREGPADREAPANQEDRADPEGPAVLEDRADLAGPEAMSRAAQAATAGMGLVNRVARANRVALVDLADMNLVVQVGRADQANPVGTSPAIQADRDPGQNQALPDRNPVHPRRAAPTPAHPHRRLPDPDPMRAHPHRTRARPHPRLTRAHPREPIHPEAATHRPAPTHPAGETRPAEVIRPVEATHQAEEATPEPREFSLQSSGFDNVKANYIGAQMNK